VFLLFRRLTAGCGQYTVRPHGLFATTLLLKTWANPIGSSLRRIIRGRRYSSQAAASQTRRRRNGSGGNQEDDRCAAAVPAHRADSPRRARIAPPRPSTGEDQLRDPQPYRPASNSSAATAEVSDGARRTCSITDAASPAATITAAGASVPPRRR
jgi:hypothetical protein